MASKVKRKFKRNKDWHEAMAGNRVIKFCNKCGEYWTKENVCSNPWCPERMD